MELFSYKLASKVVRLVMTIGKLLLFLMAKVINTLPVVKVVPTAGVYPPAVMVV
jgi:hypothetical protein